MQGTETILSLLNEKEFNIGSWEERKNQRGVMGPRTWRLPLTLETNGKRWYLQSSEIRATSHGGHTAQDRWDWWGECWWRTWRCPKKQRERKISLASPIIKFSTYACNCLNISKSHRQGSPRSILLWNGNQGRDRERHWVSFGSFLEQQSMIMKNHAHCGELCHEK